MAYRKDILAAIYEADRLHIEFDSKARAEAGEGRIDVLNMLVKHDIPLLFRPLKNLLGAFISNPDKGVIVTSQRPLSVQRFTAAHELGHAVLGHETSIDKEEILTRLSRVTDRGFDLRELQANVFATQLLTPSWLIAQHMQRQGWIPENLTNPLIVYQLSLRMASSYMATCYALEEYKAINETTRDKLLKVTPKDIKRTLLKPYKPKNWYGDVWLVTERDNGMILDGSRLDLVVLNFEEHASSGYLWHFDELANVGLAIREDARTSKLNESHIGGVVFRTVIAEPEDAHGANGHIHLQELRPWLGAGEPLHTLELNVEFSGPLRAGLLPAQREALLRAA